MHVRRVKEYYKVMEYWTFVVSGFNPGWFFCSSISSYDASRTEGVH